MQKSEETVSRLALSFVEGVNADVVRAMESAGVTAADFIAMPMQELSTALGIHPGQGFGETARQEALFRARKELEFTTAHRIRTLSWLDDDYPCRLREIPDAPVSLFVLGESDLDMEHMLALVGTRRCTAYGTSYCDTLVSDLAGFLPDLCVVSGLAYGIDAAAHSAALEHGVRTIAVVAHGLQMIYPAQHRDLAARIIKSGGAIISEYPYGATPYRGRFLERNRIVAGLTDATIVVESEIKGGAMSTARLAQSYDREVLALPGRISDSASSGCNHLIRTQRAAMAGEAADVITQLGWTPADARLEPRQRNLFPELDGEAKTIYDTLRFQSIAVTADELHRLTGIHMPALMAQLSELEFDGIITRQPGNKFVIVG